MPHRFLQWCLSLLAIAMPLWLLGCAAHESTQQYYASQRLLSSGIDQPRLPTVVVVVDDATFAELFYGAKDLESESSEQRSDPRYLGQQWTDYVGRAPLVPGNVERFLASVHKSLKSGHVIAEADPEPRLRDHSAVQRAGGLATGLAISVVPHGSIGAALAEQTGQLSAPSKQFQLGKDIGQLVGGVGQIIVGCGGIGLGTGATSTGFGAPGGVVLVGSSVEVIGNGVVSVCIASNDLVQLIYHWGDDTAAPANKTPEQTKPKSTEQETPKKAADPKGGSGQPAKPPPARKPHQPDPDKWRAKGGSIKEHSDGSTTYRRNDGVEVTYNKDGYPDFSAYRHPTVKDVQIKFTGSRPKDDRLANAAAGIREKPVGYTWHHHQDGKTMQLIKTDVHSEFYHTGGMATK